MTISKEWVYREYINREDMIIHAPYEPEMEFYSYVKSGDLDKVNRYLKRDFTSIQGRPIPFPIFIFRRLIR